MKALYFGNKINSESGFSTMEMLIALPLLVVGLSAAVLISFGSQSMALDAQTNSEGLELAQADSEQARRDADNDFYSLVDGNSTVSLGGLDYAVNRKVSDYPCMKAVESRVEWSTDGRPQYSSITTMATSLAEAINNGYDCPTGFPSPWLHPDTYDSTDLNPGGVKGTDVDVVKINGTRYAFLSSWFTNDTAPDIWVFDLSELDNPTLIASINIDSNNKDRGVNALDVAQGADGKWYAFLAHSTTASSNFRQLMVVDVTNPSSPQLISGATRSLPGVGNSFPEGWRIKFFDNKLYIGTRETSGNEFQIYSVATPINPTFLSSLQINHNVEDIIVHKQTVSGTSKTIAYLALTSSATSEEVWAVDVTNPYVPVKVGGYNGAGDVDAKSLSLSGSRLFVGKERSNAYPELLVLDISTPSSIALLASKDLPLNPNTEVVSLNAVGTYLFMGTSDANAEFQVWDIEDLSNIWQRSSFNFPATASGIEYIDNVVVLSVRSNDALHIIYDTDYPPL